MKWEQRNKGTRLLKKNLPFCVYNWGLRTSVPRYDKTRLSNVTGQILTDPQRQVFRDTIANAVRQRGGIYIRNVRRIHKQSRRAVQCCRPRDKVLFIYDLFFDTVTTATSRVEMQHECWK